MRRLTKIFLSQTRTDQPKADKRVPRRFYFTIPDQIALRELLSLWQRHQRGDGTRLGTDSMERCVRVIWPISGHGDRRIG